MHACKFTPDVYTQRLAVVGAPDIKQPSLALTVCQETEEEAAKKKLSESSESVVQEYRRQMEVRVKAWQGSLFTVLVPFVPVQSSFPEPTLLCVLAPAMGWS